MLESNVFYFKSVCVCVYVQLTGKLTKCIPIIWIVHCWILNPIVKIQRYMFLLCVLLKISYGISNYETIIQCVVHIDR